MSLAHRTIQPPFLGTLMKAHIKNALMTTAAVLATIYDKAITS